VVIDVDCAVVETGQDPRFCGVEIYSFDAIRPGEEFPLSTSVSLVENEGDLGFEHAR